MRTSVVCLVGAMVLAGCGGGGSMSRASAKAVVPAHAPSTPRPHARLESERTDRTLGSLYDRLAETARPAPGGRCALDLEGASVASEQTPDGAALVFTTSASIGELRRRVSTLSAERDSALPSARIRMDNVQNGLRVIFVPTRAAELERLRQRIRQRAEQMLASCPAMQIARVRGTSGEDEETSAESERQSTAGDESKDEKPTPSTGDQKSSEPPKDVKPESEKKPDKSAPGRDADQEKPKDKSDDKHEKDEPDDKHAPLIDDDGAEGLHRP